MVEVSSPVSREETLAEFSHALRRAGVRDALACLLRPTSYRCSGIFRFEGERVQALVAVDREFPRATEVRTWSEAVERSCYVRDTQGRLVQADASAPCADDGAQPECRAVPIMDPEGVILGTLCLYDPLPVDAAPLDIELLVEAAAALAGHEALRARKRPR